MSFFFESIRKKERKKKEKKKERKKEREMVTFR